MLRAACSPLELLMMCAIVRGQVDDDVIRNVECIIDLVMIEITCFSYLAMFLTS